MAAALDGINPFDAAPLINANTGLRYKAPPGTAALFKWVEGIGGTELLLQVGISFDNGPIIQVGANANLTFDSGAIVRGTIRLGMTIIALDNSPPYCKFRAEDYFAGNFTGISGCEKGTGNVVVRPTPGILSDLASAFPLCGVPSQSKIENIVLSVPSLIGHDPSHYPPCCS